jgi:Na+/melibiose symporter-like transporter
MNPHRRHRLAPHQDDATTTTLAAAAATSGSSGHYFLFDLLSGEAWITLCIAVSFIIPQVVLVVLLPLVRKHSLDYVITQLLRARVVLGLLAVFFFCTAPATVGPVVMLLSLLSLRLVTECVCRLQPLVLAALCDEQQQQHSEEWTASMMGAASLGSKPSQSIAPLLGYALLREISANAQQQQHHGASSAAMDPQRVLYLYGCLVGVATVPTALLSLAAWQQWPLPGVGRKKQEKTV